MLRSPGLLGGAVLGSGSLPKSDGAGADVPSAPFCCRKRGMSRPPRHLRRADEAGSRQYEGAMARPDGMRISVRDCWPAVVIAMGLIASAIWTGIIGWGLVAILALVF